MTANLLGDTHQEIGRQLSIRALPRHGYLFAGWVGDVVSAENPLFFVMSDGMTLQATFVSSPFINCQGRFYGIFESSAPETNGSWQLQMNAYGRFTGTFVTNGKRRVVSGALDAAAHWSKTFGDGVRISFEQDLQTGHATGTLEVANMVAQFSGDKLPTFSNENPLQFAGAYPLVFHTTANNSETPLPRGLGYAALRVTSKGIARFMGRLSDGVSMNVAVPITSENVIPVSTSLSRGYIHGIGKFPVQDAGNDLEGSFAWRRISDSAWPGGFSATLEIVASRWNKPSHGQRLLSAMDANNGIANVLLDAGDSVVHTTIVLDPHNLALENPPSPCALKLSVSPNMGTFRGNFLDAQFQKRAFRGVFLQRQMRGEGYFLDGAVAVTPAE